MKNTFKAIPNGVLNRLAKLTSGMEEKCKMRVNEIYPYNTVELTKAGLNMKYSDLGKLWENSNDMEKN